MHEGNYLVLTRDTTASGHSTDRDAAGSGAVYSLGSRSIAISPSADTLWKTVAVVAVVEGHPEDYSRAVVLPRDHRECQDSTDSSRHVSDGKVLRGGGVMRLNICNNIISVLKY